MTAAGATLVLAVTALGRRSRRAVALDPEQAALSRAGESITATVTSSDGTTLHVEIFGSDEPPTVVLVHGLTCTLHFWRYQLQELAHGHRVVAFDLRGHGASDPAAEADYSTSALAADLDAVLEACVPAGERVLIAGHSMGAMSIVAWAGAHPDKVRQRLAGAVLVNTGVERLIDEARILITAAALSTVKRWIGRRVLGISLHGPRRPTAVFQRIVRYVALGRRATPAQVAFCERLFLDCPADVRAAFGATLSDLDLGSALQALTVPTVVIAGEQDRLTPPVHARSIAAALPDAPILELPGVGHCAPIEAHADVSTQIKNLAARTIKARAAE